LQAAFSDFAGYLVATERSLAAVNEKLEEKVTMKNFRPTIMIDGCAAFDEVSTGIGLRNQYELLHQL
jgi:uncharacterized protein YcbX